MWNAHKLGKKFPNDFDKLKWCLPSLVFTLLLPDWKHNKGKETPCELVGAHVYGWTDVLDQHWKCLQKRLLILMHFTCNIYRDKQFHIGKEVLSQETLPIALSEMQWKRSVSSYNLNTCKFSQQADKHQHQDLGVCVLGGWRGSSLLILLAWVSCVTQESLAFTTPCSAAILLP